MTTPRHPNKHPIKKQTASDIFNMGLEGFRNAQAINEALKKHKFKKKEKLQEFLLTWIDMLRIKSLHSFLTKFGVPPSAGTGSSQVPS